MSDAFKRQVYLAWQHALNAVFPRVRCAACGEALPLENGLCGVCAPALEPAPEGTPAAFLYRDAGRDLIWRLKFHAERDVAFLLGKAMAMHLPPGPWDALVPVPPSSRGGRSRGYNQARDLAMAIWLHGGPPVLDALRKTRHTQKQSTLSRAERGENIRGAFAARRSVKGLSLLVIDDIYTTGATSASCEAALRDAGALRTASFCAAFTPMED